MSKIGLNPIKIEDGVTIEVSNSNIVVKGPLGELSLKYPNFLKIEVVDGSVLLTRLNEEKFTKSMHGTIRSLVANMIKGVKSGYEKKLEVVGVGFRAKMEGNDISLNLGYNHPIIVKVPSHLKANVPDEGTIIISGIDNQEVGKFAAKVRELKKPEPYKGKGIRYEGEYVRRKSAKSAATKK